MTQSNGAENCKELVLLGGGHSHVEVLRQFGMKPPNDCQITLVARDSHAPYSGMLPGYIAGHYDFYQSHIDLRPLARFGKALVYQDEVIGVDLVGKKVLCKERPPVHFDLLSINVGSRPSMADVPGAAKYALPVKPVDRFIKGWHDLLDRVQAGDGPSRILVVGGGAGGVELSLTMQHRYKRVLKEAGGKDGLPEFHIATDSEDVLPTHNAGVRKKMNKVLRKRGVQVHLNSRIINVNPDAVECEENGTIPYDTLIWVTTAAPQSWIKESGLETDDRGFVAVDKTLRSTSHPFVFAAGDVATMVADPRPKSGVFAVRAGPILAKNLRHAVAGEALEPFKAQKEFLSLIGTGDKKAIASRGRWSFKGRTMWWLKEWIDTRWMAKYANLPAMETESGEPMRCGGCGCKVGGDLLSRVLERLPSGGHGAVVGLDQPDDAAVVEAPAGKHAVHTVDFFRSFLDDPYVFGRIAANHCLTDLYAMGAEPSHALAIVVLPYSQEEKMERLLYDVLAGAVRELEQQQTHLLGGHTTEGAEFIFGLAVHGWAAPEQLLSKSGMRADDVLILTKPIGTGVIMAGEMRGKARGAWVDEALQSMLVSNRAAVDVLREHGATACTDVTGFGLAGHLLEMTKASDVAVQLDLDRIPLLEGAAALAHEGVQSTLYPANARAAASVAKTADFDTHDAYNLLFDPQTSGGLLASVPQATAQQCVQALQESGFLRASAIGHVKPATDKSHQISLGRPETFDVSSQTGQEAERQETAPE